MSEIVATKQPSSRTRLLQIVTSELSKNTNTDDGLKLLDLNIVSIPPELIELIKDNASKLSLQKNSLTQLPNYFARLTNLRYLDLHGNKFTEFPSVLCSFDSLEILDISENFIKKLPLDIGNLVNLKVLSLKDNRFEYLPSSISAMTNLSILEVSNNPLVEPSMEMIVKWQNGEEDWLTSLRNYLTDNTKHLDIKIQDTSELRVEPRTERSRSDSSVSTKAAKRMGFIVNKKSFTPISSHEEEGVSPTHTQPSTTLPHSAPPLPQQPAPQVPQSGNQTQNPQIQRPTHQHSLSQPDLMKPNLFPSTGLSSSSRIRSLTVSTNSRSMGDAAQLQSPMDDIKEELDPKNGALQKRLSTLDEIEKPSDSTIISVARKLSYIYSSLHENLIKLELFCGGRDLAIKLNNHLTVLKEHIETFHRLFRALESDTKNKSHSIDLLLHCVISSLALNKRLMKLIQLNVQDFFINADIVYIRSLYLTIFGSFMELYNSCKLLYPSSVVETDIRKQSLGSQSDHSSQDPQQPPTLRIDTGITQQVNPPVIQSAQQNPTVVSDERLLESVHNATSAAQVVFSQLTNAINKTALSNASSKNVSANEQLSESIAAKVKDLTSICVVAIDSTKSLKNSLHVVSTSIPQQQDKLKFYRDANVFLKSIINILNTTKSSINDLPILNELRPSLALLTKLTKDVTIMLENSTFKTIYVSQQYGSHDDNASNQPQQPVSSQQLPQSAIASHPPPLSSIPSMTAFPPFHQQSLLVQQQQLNSIQASLPPVTTPLVAALGNTQSQVVIPGNSITSPLNNTLPPPAQQQQQQQQQLQQQQQNAGVNPFEAFFSETGLNDEETSL